MSVCFRHSSRLSIPSSERQESATSDDDDDEEEEEEEKEVDAAAPPPWPSSSPPAAFSTCATACPSWILLFVVKHTADETVIRPPHTHWTRAKERQTHMSRPR